MDRALQIFIGLSALPLFAGGARIMFAPQGVFERLGLAPDAALGLNSIRGAIGGLLVGSAVMLGLGLFRQQTLWFVAVAVLMGVVSFGRVVGIVFDGADPIAVKATAVELVLMAILIVAHLRGGNA